jgi:hypothetical protein
LFQSTWKRYAVLLCQHVYWGYGYHGGVSELREGFQNRMPQGGPTRRQHVAARSRVLFALALHHFGVTGLGLPMPPTFGAAWNHYAQKRVFGSAPVEGIMAATAFAIGTSISIYFTNSRHYSLLYPLWSVTTLTRFFVALYAVYRAPDTLVEPT